MSIKDKIFVSHFRKQQRVRNDIGDWSHNKRVRHFINLGLDQFMAEKLATAYGRNRNYGGSYE